MRLGLGLSLRHQAAGLAGIADRMPYFLDFVADQYKGGNQPYGNNSDSGNRFFRDSGVSNACFIPKADGSLQSTAAAGMRRSDKGTISFQNIGTIGLYNGDLTQAGSWTKSATLTVAKTTGADGLANTGSRLTCGAANDNILQTATAAQANRVATPFVKRITGTGRVWYTFDGGTTKIDITAQVNAGGPANGFGKALVSQASVTNPNWGFFMETPGDVIEVDFVNNHGQIQGLNLDPMHYPRILGTTFGSIFHETAWAINTDKGPLGVAPNILSQIIKGAYCAYWEGYNYVPNLGGLLISDGVTNCQLIAGNNVTFAAGVNLNTTGGEWKTGEQINKVLFQLDAAGNMGLAVNGVYYSRSGGSMSGSATHFVLGNNGAATIPLNGWTRKFGIGVGWYTQAEAVVMTQ